MKGAQVPYNGSGAWSYHINFKRKQERKQLWNGYMNTSGRKTTADGLTIVQKTTNQGLSNEI
jgi:hypothetical protein